MACYKIKEIKTGGFLKTFLCLGFGVLFAFASERPDMELKRGPDNLWNVKTGEYVLFECKSEVDERRSEIVKDEAAQINTSCGWFKENYAGETVKNILVIPGKDISAQAAFTQDVEVLRKAGLNKLVNNVRRFFDEFKEFDIKTITEKQIDIYLTSHK